MKFIFIMIIENDKLLIKYINDEDHENIISVLKNRNDYYYLKLFDKKNLYLFKNKNSKYLKLGKAYYYFYYLGNYTSYIKKIKILIKKYFDIHQHFIFLMYTYIYLSKYNKAKFYFNRIKNIIFFQFFKTFPKKKDFIFMILIKN